MVNVAMIDNIRINKAATIERCVGRAWEEYEKSPDDFERDFTRQDAAILNIQRACEASIDAGTHIIRQKQLGVPQSARGIFELLEENGVIDSALAETLKKMVGFRNIAVHDYQKVQIPIVIAIINNHLQDLLRFAKVLLQAPD